MRHYQCLSFPQLRNPFVLPSDATLILALLLLSLPFRSITAQIHFYVKHYLANLYQLNAELLLFLSYLFLDIPSHLQSVMIYSFPFLFESIRFYSVPFPLQTLPSLAIPFRIRPTALELYSSAMTLVSFPFHLITFHCASLPFIFN